METLETKVFVLISELSLFQGENNMKLGLIQAYVLINQASLFQSVL